MGVIESRRVIWWLKGVKGLVRGHVIHVRVMSVMDVPGWSKRFMGGPSFSCKGHRWGHGWFIGRCWGSSGS